MSRKNIWVERIYESKKYMSQKNIWVEKIYES